MPFVPHTSVRIAMPLICSGHIDQRIRRHFRCGDPCGSIPKSLDQLTSGGLTSLASRFTADARHGHSIDVTMRLSPSARERLAGDLGGEQEQVILGAPAGTMERGEFTG